MANPYVGAGFDQYVDTRQIPGQSQLEFFNKQSGQAFTPKDLANFAGVQSGRTDINEGNVFDVLKQGFTPRAQALDQIRTELNTFQNEAFAKEATPNKRASSSLSESIAAGQTDYDTAFSEYKTLQEQLKALSSPNYQQTYEELRTKAGVPGIENDFANNQKTIRELPYVNRMNFGNAGVATEGQLNADTQQKGIPLEIQQANLLDRLKLAEAFVENSLKFRQMDDNASRQSLKDALSTAFDTISLTRTHLNDLLEREKSERATQQANEQFAFENRITKPFYEIAGTVYRTSDRRVAHNRNEYIAMGGTGDFSDTQKIDANLKADEEYVLDLRDSYPDAGILPTDSAIEAAQKLQNSRIYNDKVRGPVGSSRSGRRLSGSNGIFTDSQLLKGAGAAGMSIEQFARLSEDEQNRYIYGEDSDLEGGRLPDTDYEDYQAEIDDMFAEGMGLGEVRDAIDNADIPQQDKEELKAYAEDVAPDEGFFQNLLKKLNPFD